MCRVRIVRLEQFIKTMLGGGEREGGNSVAGPPEPWCPNRHEKRGYCLQSLGKVGQALYDNVFAGVLHSIILTDSVMKKHTPDDVCFYILEGFAFRVQPPAIAGGADNTYAAASATTLGASSAAPSA